MKGKIIAATTLGLVGIGCGHAAVQPPTSSSNQVQAARAAANPPAVLGDFVTSRANAHHYLLTFESPAASAVHARKPGDFIVYRFSSRAQEQPVIVTERVISRKHETIVVDQSIDQGEGPLHLRLRIHDGDGRANRIISVARLLDGVQVPFGMATYDALMAAVMPPVDVAHRWVGSVRTQIDVGGQSIDCEKSSYRVEVDGEPAFMTVWQSPDFVWGDIGGEIRNYRGELLYKAEVVLLSNGHDRAAQPVVQALFPGEPEDAYEAWERESEVAVADLEAIVAAAAQPAQQSEPEQPVQVSAAFEPDLDEDWDDMD